MTEENSNNSDSCIFPKCHECNEGRLIPFSFKEDVFEKWLCTKCGHLIRKPRKEY